MGNSDGGFTISQRCCDNLLEGQCNAGLPGLVKSRLFLIMACGGYLRIARISLRSADYNLAQDEYPLMQLAAKLHGEYILSFLDCFVI